MVSCLFCCAVSHPKFCRETMTDRASSAVWNVDLQLLLSHADGSAAMLPLQIADTSKEISAAYGVLVTDPADALYGAALRGLFIIDPKGVVRSVQVNDESVGRSVSEVLRLVRAFQYADQHG